jgi:hypothetical protein
VFSTQERLRSSSQKYKNLNNFRLEMTLKTRQIISFLFIALSSSGAFADGVLSKYSAIHLRFENQIYDSELCIAALESGRQKSPTDGLCAVLNPENILKFNREVDALAEEAEGLVLKAKKAGTVNKVLAYRIRGAQLYYAYLLEAQANQLSVVLAVDEALKAKAMSQDK